ATEELRKLWQDAIKKFQQSNQADVPQWNSSFQEMATCSSAEDICRVLENNFLSKIQDARGERWMTFRENCLKPAVNILLKLTDSLGELAGATPIVPGGKSIFVAFGVLLKATMGVSLWFDELKDFFGDFSHFLEQIWRVLPFYNEMGAAYQNIASAILVLTIGVISAAMKEVMKGKIRLRFKLYWEALKGSDEITKARERINKLMDQASNMTIVTTAEKVIQTHQTVLQILQKQENEMDKHFLNLQLEERLDKKLNPVKAAYINSDKVCLEGTRVHILDQISDWVLSPSNDSSHMFLLCGPAGTGKSAISHTIGKRFKEMNYLGAFFCFDRTFLAERTPVRAVQSIAYGLSQHLPGFGKALIEIMEKDPYILSSPSIVEQWKFLIVDPAQEVKEKDKSTPVVIIIDALDECGHREEGGPREKLISLLLDGAQDLPKNFRILVTSRLESDIIELFEEHLNVIQIQDMNNLSETKEDIYIYILDRMKKSIKQGVLDVEQCRFLAEKAEGYFQWAYTVCNALGQKQKPGVKVKSLKQRFEQFISLSPSPNKELQPLDSLYKSILQDIFDREDEAAMREYRKVMSQVLASRVPLSQQSLERLQLAYSEYTGIEDDKSGVNVVVPYLGSLLSGVNRSDAPVRPVHTSVRDFLLDKSRSGDYAINPAEGHYIMALGTIQLMIEKLHFNMCNLESSHIFNSKVENLSDKIEKCVSSEIKYACCYWYTHLLYIQPTHTALNLMEIFFLKSSLYWLELLGVLGKVDIIPESIEKMIEWIQPMEENCPNLKIVGQEISQLVYVFGKILSESTPHLYLSTLPFLPKGSILQKIFVSQFANIAQICQGHRVGWPYLQAILRGHTGPVHSVAFSPDGKKIVSGSMDCSVQIWDAETGQAEGEPMQGHTKGVLSVAFSPDGKKIVTGSRDKLLQIWDLETGNPEGEPLQGHTHSVYSVAFSQDGRKIVSGSKDSSLRVWNAVTGSAEGEPLQGHTGSVYSTAFSPDGKKIVSGSFDKSVRIWNVETGKADGELQQHHTASILSVAFSPNGKSIISGSKDKSVQIWNVKSRKPEGELLQGHTDWIYSVAFSPDGKRAISGSRDKTIWHKSWIHSVAFSPDGTKIVSGSKDKSLRIWNAETGKAEGEPLQGHAGSVYSAAFSPDGKKIVSGSLDKSGMETGYTLLHFFQMEKIVILRSDGWLCGPDSSLILWIPPEYRECLMFPHMELLLPQTQLASLNLKNFVHGKEWAKCYR
ncbi:hypothetical protein GYMLUDRAFT_977718, partial [Collybiopsis luxurians FD-317 M1]